MGRKKEKTIQTFNGIIRLKHVNPGSKSEGTAAWLEIDSENGLEKLRLYRNDMPDVDDPLFAGLNDRRVTVNGEKESSAYLRVEKLTVIEEPESEETDTDETINNNNDE